MSPRRPWVILDQQDMARAESGRRLCENLTGHRRACISARQKQRDRGPLARRVGKRRVAMLGLTFKPDTDDLRESPLVELVERLIGKGFEVAIYDRDLQLSRLIGSNRRLIACRSASGSLSPTSSSCGMSAVLP